MPLMKKASKKAFEHNVREEMSAHPDKRAQDLAIAYSVQRRAKAKKMAQGGSVSAANEKRPMPEQRSDDAHMVARNDHKAPLKDAQWTDQPELKQARKGLKTTPIKHPKMVPSDILQARLMREEDNLMASAKPNNGPQRQPPEVDNEMGPDRQGPKVPDMQKEHSNHRKPYAKGGMINEAVSFKDADEDHVEHPAHLEEDDDQMAPAESEYMADHFAEGGMAHEFDDQPENEEQMEHHASIVAAIMAKRAAKEALHSGSEDEDHAEMYADGGEVDLDLNAEEAPADPNEFDERNEYAAMKENYDEDMHHVDQPMDSNEHGDEEEKRSENKHDSSIVAKIMAKRKKSPITR